MSVREYSLLYYSILYNNMSLALAVAPNPLYLLRLHPPHSYVIFVNFFTWLFFYNHYFCYERNY